MRSPARAEIWSIELDPVRGHEQGGRRPCLVISDDIYNSGPAAKHIVIPISSKYKGIPYHIEMLPPEGGLRARSFVLCDDIRSVSRDRLAQWQGVASARTMAAVVHSLKALIGV